LLNVLQLSIANAVGAQAVAVPWLLLWIVVAYAGLCYEFYTLLNGLTQLLGNLHMEVILIVL